MTENTLKAPPKLPGALPLMGHIGTFGKNPHGFMMKLREEYGDVAEFKLFHQEMVLLTGEEASEVFYRAPDEVLDQGPAYKMMTPIFGKGVVFDAPLKRKNEQLQMLMPALREKPMRTYSDLIVAEVEDMLKSWGESGERDLLEFTKELTIYTSSHCLLGAEFRYELSSEFVEIYHHLEQGIQPIAYIFPYLPLPIFRRRDQARKRLQKMVDEIMEKRAGSQETKTNVFQTLIEARYEDGSKLTPHEITGMLIAAIFAGHHTSSGTTAWVLIELLRNPKHLQDVVEEVDRLFDENGAVSFEAIKNMPKLENVIKEVLRLHPPLIVLIRKVMQDIQVKDYLIKAGKFVIAAPSVTHRIPELFPDPEKFDPDRYMPERNEDKSLYGWQAFGGGRHRCSGNAFAMFQIKGIISVLLKRYQFELVNPAASYQDDYQQMVVEPLSPCPIRYRKRVVDSAQPVELVSQAAEAQDAASTFQVKVDWELCKGHGNCMAEAPEIFQVDEEGKLTVLTENPEAALLDKARAAEKFCPSRAISLVTNG
jgi:sterol 14-demethylase